MRDHPHEDAVAVPELVLECGGDVKHEKANSDIAGKAVNPAPRNGKGGAKSWNEDETEYLNSRHLRVSCGELSLRPSQLHPALSTGCKTSAGACSVALSLSC